MCAVTNMAVVCSFLTSCFPGMLFRYSLSDEIIIIIINIIIMIITVILVITCTHGIYNSIPETSHFSTVYIVAAVLCYLQFVLHVMLFLT